jgi:hypothetical protein
LIGVIAPIRIGVLSLVRNIYLEVIQQRVIDVEYHSTRVDGLGRITWRHSAKPDSVSSVALRNVVSVRSRTY